MEESCDGHCWRFELASFLFLESFASIVHTELHLEHMISILILDWCINISWAPSMLCDAMSPKQLAQAHKNEGTQEVTDFFWRNEGTERKQTDDGTDTKWLVIVAPRGGSLILILLMGLLNPVNVGSDVDILKELLEFPQRGRVPWKVAK